MAALVLLQIVFIEEGSLIPLGIEIKDHLIRDIGCGTLELLSKVPAAVIEELLTNHAFKLMVNRFGDIIREVSPRINGKKCRKRVLLHPRHWQAIYVPPLDDLRDQVEIFRSRQPSEVSMLVKLSHSDDCHSKLVSSVSRATLDSCTKLYLSEINEVASAIHDRNKSHHISKARDLGKLIIAGESSCSDETQFVTDLAPNLLRMVQMFLIINNNTSYESLANVKTLELVNMRVRNVAGYQSELKTCLSLFMDCSHVCETAKDMLCRLGLIYSADTCRSIRREAFASLEKFKRLPGKVPVVLLDNFNRLPKEYSHFQEWKTHSCATMTSLVGQVDVRRLSEISTSYNSRHREFWFEDYDSSKLKLPIVGRDTQPFHLFDHYQLLDVLDCKSSSGADYLDVVLPFLEEKLGLAEGPVMFVGDTELTLNFERLTRSEPERMRNMWLFPYPWHTEWHGLKCLFCQPFMFKLIMKPICSILFKETLKHSLAAWDDSIVSMMRARLSGQKIRKRKLCTILEDEESIMGDDESTPEVQEEDQENEVDLEHNNDADDDVPDFMLDEDIDVNDDCTQDYEALNEILCSDEVINLLLEVEMYGKGTKLNSKQRGAIKISSSKLFYLFNILNLAWQKVKSEVIDNGLNDLGKYMVKLMEHIEAFIEPFNLKNSGDGTSFLRHQSYYCQFFYCFQMPQVAKASAITLQRLFLWKDNEDIMQAFLIHIKYFNELHIERFHSVLQRSLAVAMVPEFQAIKDAAERASMLHIVKAQLEGVSGMRLDDSSSNVDETLIYLEKAKKSQDLVATTKWMLKTVFEQCSVTQCKGLKTTNIDPSLIEKSNDFSMKPCESEMSEDF